MGNFMTEKMNRRQFTGLAGAGLLSLALTGKSAAGDSGRLLGGSAKVDITPPVGGWLSGWAIRDQPSLGVADPLYAKTIVLSNGAAEIALLSADLVGVPGEIVASVRREAERTTGMPGGNIMVCATHTHFGPVVRQHKFEQKADPAYLEELTRKLAAVIAEAHSRLAPVRLGAAWGEAPELAFNRRMKRADGKVVMTFVLPPAEPGLAFGPSDPAVGVLRMEDSQGSLVASMINFACHPVSGGGHGEGWESWFYDISADYPAYASGVVEQAEGGNCLFTLGAAGDLVPVRRGIRPRFAIGRALGGEALRKLQFMETSGEVPLKAARGEVTLPLKKELPPDSNYEAPGKTELSAEIQGFRLGEILLVGLPGEVLVELGLEIKKRAAADKLFLISLANDTLGYICHAQAYEEGGYEPVAGTLLAKGAGEIVLAQALKVIRELKA